MSDVPAEAPADEPVMPVTVPATAAYARLYREEQPRLVAYARSLTGNAWIADDLVAEAHFRVWRRLSAGHEIENVPAYLMTTVRHLAAAVGRGAARETPRDPRTVESAERIDVHGDGADDPGARVSSVDLLGRVLGQLPERWVKALWLAEAEGQPLEAVGRRIGAGQGATAVLLHRAREGMRQAFLRAHPGTPEDPACEQHWDRIPGHIRGEASARQSERLLAHLDGCADCRARLALLTRANDRLPALVGPALLIFVLGGAGKFLVPLAGAAGAASAPGGHGGFLHGVRHVFTGGGKIPAAAVGVVGASVAGAAVAAGLVLGGSGNAAPPQRATAVESHPAQPPAAEAPVPAPRSEDRPATPAEKPPPAPAATPAEQQAPAPQDAPAEQDTPAEQTPPPQPQQAQQAQPEAPAPTDPADPPAPPTPAEPTEPAPPTEPTEPVTPTPPPLTPTPTPTPTPPPTPTPVDPTPPVPTPVDPTPVDPTPPPEPVCEPWIGPIYVCHTP
ncbi:sigma factor [Streptomyces sp. NPDC059037]|uniref:sigma factor n=1 Tax=Streptomyces sp. NPDC059037 TaxID=3346710 RepID=UPI00369A31D1